MKLATHEGTGCHKQIRRIMWRKGRKGYILQPPDLASRSILIWQLPWLQVGEDSAVQNIKLAVVGVERHPGGIKGRLWLKSSNIQNADNESAHIAAYQTQPADCYVIFLY